MINFILAFTMNEKCHSMKVKTFHSIKYLNIFFHERNQYDASKFMIWHIFCNDFLCCNCKRIYKDALVLFAVFLKHFRYHVKGVPVPVIAITDYSSISMTGQATLENIWKGQSHKFLDKNRRQQGYCRVSNLDVKFFVCGPISSPMKLN